MAKLLTKTLSVYHAKSIVLSQKVTLEKYLNKKIWLNKLYKAIRRTSLERKVTTPKALYAVGLQSWFFFYDKADLNITFPDRHGTEAFNTLNHKVIAFIFTHMRVFSLLRHAPLNTPNLVERGAE